MQNRLWLAKAEMPVAEDTVIINVSTPKRNKTCDKKAVKKDWIEDIVIYQVMKFIDDDLLIEMLVNKILSIQGKESPMLKSLKKQLVQTDRAIENMLNAIEQGIITKSTKKRLDEH